MRLVPSALTAADTTPDPEPATPAAVRRMLDLLVESSEPAVVFTSAVRLCVPLICDSAGVTMVGAEQRYAITWPRSATVDTAPTHAVRALIIGQPTEAYPSYRGTLTLVLRSPPGDQHAGLAELVVDRATTLVQRARLIDLGDRSTARAAQLDVALASNRDIGMAIGILMSLRKVTRGHAFDLLCEVSQRTNRKVRAVAIDVIDTGTIESITDLRSPPTRCAS